MRTIMKNWNKVRGTPIAYNLLDYSYKVYLKENKEKCGEEEKNIHLDRKSE